MKRLFLRSALACGLAALVFTPLLSVAAQAADSADQAAIRKAMMAIWDKPEDRLTVDPIVVVADHAIAPWSQGPRGGRALLQRNPQGQWKVAACAGDGFKDAKTLEMAGIPAPVVRQLLAGLNKAEAAVPAPRRALFSTFDGIVRMDASGTHAPHAPSSQKH